MISFFKTKGLKIGSFLRIRAAVNFGSIKKRVVASKPTLSHKQQLQTLSNFKNMPLGNIMTATSSLWKVF
jgi:hypothetical protein